MTILTRKLPSWISSNNNSIKFFAGICIGAIFLYLSIRNVNMGEMVIALTKANYWYFLLAIFILMFSHYLRALRWQLFLAPIKTIHSAGLFSALVIGYAANTFVPAHLGEFLRAFVLGKRHNIFASTTFASIVLERIVDVLSLILVMVLVIFIHPFPLWVIQKGNHEKFSLGSTRPFFSDGVLHHKLNWGAKIVSETSHAFLLSLLSKKKCLKSFLTNNPFILNDKNTLTLAVFSDQNFKECPYLPKDHSKIKLYGLDKITSFSL